MRPVPCRDDLFSSNANVNARFASPGWVGFLIGRPRCLGQVVIYAGT